LYELTGNANIASEIACPANVVVLGTDAPISECTNASNTTIEAELVNDINVDVDDTFESQKEDTSNINQKSELQKKQSR
jgi:hypothetical protein